MTQHFCNDYGRVNYLAVAHIPDVGLVFVGAERTTALHSAHTPISVKRAPRRAARAGRPRNDNKLGTVSGKLHGDLCPNAAGTVPAGFRTAGPQRLRRTRAQARPQHARLRDCNMG